MSRACKCDRCNKFYERPDDNDAEAAKELITKNSTKKKLQGVECLLSQIYQTSKWTSQKLKQADL